jgi:hypothetical protein
MFRREEMPLLQKAAEDEFVRGRMRSNGIAATIFGVLALFSGVMPPANFVLIALGALLSFCGLWNLVMVTPAGLLMTAISLLAVGAFNLVSSFAGPHGSGAWPVIGVLQLVWGYNAIGRWRRFRHTLSDDVPDTMRKSARDLLNGLRRANPAKEPDVVVMVAGGTRPTSVRLRLAPEGVLVVANGVDDVAFAPREQVGFEAKGESSFPKGMKGTLRVAGRSWTGTVSPEGAERLRRWQAAGAPTQRAA